MITTQFDANLGFVYINLGYSVFIRGFRSLEGVELSNLQLTSTLIHLLKFEKHTNIIRVPLVNDYCKEPFIKDVRSQGGEEVCPVRTRGVLQIRTSALFSAKNLEFFEIYGVSVRTGGGGEEGV